MQHASSKKQSAIGPQLSGFTLRPLATDRYGYKHKRQCPLCSFSQTIFKYRDTCKPFVCLNSDFRAGFVRGHGQHVSYNSCPRWWPWSWDTSATLNIFYFEGLHWSLPVKFANLAMERLTVHKASINEICHILRCLMK